MSNNSKRLHKENNKIGSTPPLSTRLIEPTRTQFLEYCKEKGISCNFAINAILSEFLKNGSANKFIISSIKSNSKEGKSNES